MRLWLLATTVLMCVLAGCGGGGGDDGGGDATDLLDQAFAKSLSSARVNLDGQLTVDGIDALQRPIRLQARGPFTGGDFEIDLKIGVGTGQTVDTGSLSTGDRSFVKFEDSWYELDRDQVRTGAIGGRCAARAVAAGARGWVKDARDEGIETVQGVETTHVSGRLDVRRTLRGLSRFAARCGRALGAGDRVARPLPRRDLERVARLVGDPSFEVYVGREDGLVHRVSTRLDVQVPEAERERVGGLSGATLELAVNFSELDRPQRIEAPEDARPIAELSKRLGGAAALSAGLKGLGDGPGGSGLSGATPATPPGSGGPEAPGPDAFRRDSDCLEKADPRSRTALQRCSRLLDRSR
jgi:hypothetical protein